ncbi:type VII secretion system-associated protein [Streptomyces albus]|uniref:type VII secretion system-associated protein n=1 Tax=Streptomyces TaxID=1883 RepID=UPI0007C4DFF6|nr:MULTISPECIES: type VII secretion system-associated protein [Streptomyces]QID37335.1 type VII secretion system-associated protein [Streptomyces albus]GHJ23273.1 hypothetical protein TPA0909_48870 [Streptomyces albus]
MATSPNDRDSILGAGFDIDPENVPEDPPERTSSPSGSTHSAPVAPPTPPEEPSEGAEQPADSADAAGSPENSEPPSAPEDRPAGPAEAAGTAEAEIPETARAAETAETTAGAGPDGEGTAAEAAAAPVADRASSARSEETADGGEDSGADGTADGPEPEPEQGPEPGSEEQKPIKLLVQRGEEGFPEPPEDIVEAAKVAPDHWLNVVDQHWKPEDGQAPPMWARLGRWRSDEHGEIVEWEHNPEYRPSPERLGWPKPHGEVDAAVQRAATGYGPEIAVVEALAGTEVAVCVDEEGRPARSEAPNGTTAVAVFTPGAELPEGQEMPAHEVMHVDRLLDQLADGEEVLFLSSTAPVAHLVDPAELRDMGERKQPATQGAAEGGAAR